ALRPRLEALRAAPHETIVEALRRILATWPFDRDRVRPALGPTIAMHCTDPFLLACRDLAAEHDVGLHMH
ncbi:MAG: amidohydrolase, partial [Gammaproteobacteria bacterium]|nr:amidohydrolase [Gammaproteobacteria bacterium]